MQNDHRNLHQQIQAILEENRAINSKLEILKTATVNAGHSSDHNDSRDDATREKQSKEVLTNVKKQVDYLQAENNDLRSLQTSTQKTIENLEKEIQHYRNQLFKPTSICEVKQKYSTAIKILENTIINQKTELKEQAHLIQNLLEQKKGYRGHIEKIEKKLESKENELKKLPETTETLIKLRKQLEETTKVNLELQKSLKLSKAALEERFKKEQSALQKVQEALAIAEAAVADKDEVLKREKVLKEECDNIASTIGQVMDEAARRVEQDMESIRNKYHEKERILNEEKQKMNEEMQNQKKFNQILDTRCNRFENKYKESLKDNDRLTQQLELAAKTLYEMEQRLNAKENSVELDEEITKKRIQDQEKEIRHYVETNKQLKEKYRVALNEVTNEFKQEIYRLQSELAKARTENQLLKVHKHYSADIPLDN